MPDHFRDLFTDLQRQVFERFLFPVVLMATASSVALYSARNDQRSRYGSDLRVPGADQLADHDHLYLAATIF